MLEEYGEILFDYIPQKESVSHGALSLNLIVDRSVQ